MNIYKVERKGPDGELTTPEFCPSLTKARAVAKAWAEEYKEDGFSARILTVKAGRTSPSICTLLNRYLPEYSTDE